MNDFLFCILGLFALFGANAMAEELVTPEEARTSQQALMLEADMAMPDPMAPLIQLLSPDTLEKPLKNPLKMEVMFKPQQGASLDFSTFKAFYGSFKIDITDRLLKKAVTTASSIKLVNVDIPSGKHKLLISIKDDAGRTAAKEIAFNVE